ncbi:GPP34 family phosphoprotein [Catenuloplanes niger JCM 9533]
MSLAEELVLIAYDTDGTAWGTGTAVNFAVAGAHLMELALAGRIAVHDGRVTVLDPTPTGSPPADTALATLTADPAPRRPKDAVNLLSKKALQPVLDRLVETGVVERHDRKVLLVVPFTRYPSPGGVEPAAETARRRLMHAAVTDPHATPDDRTQALVALVTAADWHRRAFPGLPKHTIKPRFTGVIEDLRTAVKNAIADTYT